MVLISIFFALSLAFLCESLPIEPEFHAISNLTEHAWQQDEDWQLVPDQNWELRWVDVNAFRDDAPFFNPSNDVRFLLFTQNNPNDAQVINLNDGDQLRNSNFNPANPTRFIVHGWNNDGNSPLNPTIRNAYLQVGDFNVISVDWGRGANTINYISARNRVGGVAYVVSQFINFLADHGLTLDSVLIVGHSLGAHIAGLTGKQFTDTQIATIVGLDAALPLFSSDKPNDRIHTFDAVNVQTIHTDIGRLGFSTPIGQASFYPNWGGPHPGCGWDLVGTCGHSRSWEFFAESIVNNNFWGTQCQSYQNIRNKNCVPSGDDELMAGEPVAKGIEGIYYLSTNSNNPFAIGQRSAKMIF